MTFLRSHLPVLQWAPQYDRGDLRSDLAAGVTVGAMLVPQGMAYALLAGLPPAVGLYAATVPVIIYALFGTSRQLAVGPVAIVSLLTASALAPLVEEGTAGYVSAAALLALMVGVVHIVLGAGRMGYLVNFLSHSVLIGFTAAAAIIIGFSQTKHVLGISIERKEHFYETVLEVLDNLAGTHGLTLAIGLISVAVLFALKRFAKRVPGALVVVVGSILAVELFNLEDRGVKVVGDIPDSLPAFGLPDFDGSLIGNLIGTAFVITLVGFMESIAVAKVYARRHRYEVEPNAELIGLGAANVASGLFGGYPVTGGFSRTAVKRHRRCSNSTGIACHRWHRAADDCVPHAAAHLVAQRGTWCDHNRGDRWSGRHSRNAPYRQDQTIRLDRTRRGVRCHLGARD